MNLKGCHSDSVTKLRLLTSTRNKQYVGPSCLPGLILPLPFRKKGSVVSLIQGNDFAFQNCSSSLARSFPHLSPATRSSPLVASSLEIPLIHIFKGKWALIQAKLTDFSDFPTVVTNSLSLDLLLSVANTLRDAVSLARRCQVASLTEGKLRTQSDVDSVLAKLDFHLRDDEILFKSGVLHDTAGFSSSSLLAILQADDKNVMIAVAQGIVPMLVKLLDSSSFEMKENVVAAVSMVESSRNILDAEGLLLLNHLLRVLDSGSGFAKEKACVALQALLF